MALIDYLTRFSDDQAVTTSAASTNYINGLAAGTGINDQIFLIAGVGTAFAGGTSLEISWQTSTSSDFSTYATLFTSGTILLADLTANTVLVQVPIPIGTLQYNRLYYTVDGTMTAGTVNAFLQCGVVVGV
ncbi:MAG: hypothetical protein H6Q73_197 [Firmicutes bacterium]|nr:hypothetical protein [Bacillota bacterium]